MSSSFYILFHLIQRAHAYNSRGYVLLNYVPKSEGCYFWGYIRKRSAGQRLHGDYAHIALHSQWQDVAPRIPINDVNGHLDNVKLVSFNSLYQDIFLMTGKSCKTYLARRLCFPQTFQ